ncbi:DUF3857 domain-containing protein [Pseudotenacibaculum haliotis]|uniref:DUF3857 domain-containing protein n=1 Tax=Pseudotenacibaculum haliotis TaxID=1862138 RepID=A0ABW5LV58_9FLAO
MKRMIMSLLLVASATVVFSQDYKFGKVSKEELLEKSYEKDSTAAAAYLYKYRRTYYTYSSHDGYILMTEYHTRLKIYDKEGFDKATKEISYYRPESGNVEKVTGIKAYTYNLEDGKIVKTKLNSKDVFQTKASKYISKKKITMPNVKEGSVVEWKYKITSPYPTSIDDLEFQFDIPVRKLYYSISILESLKFNTLSKGFYTIAPEIKRTSGNVISKYNGENIPALNDDEPFVDNIKNYRGGLKYELTSIQPPNSIPKFFSTSWDKVTKQIYSAKSFGGELNKSGYYKDDLASLIAGKSNSLEKIALIYQFVKGKVKWNGYYGKTSDAGVRKAYKTGVGNVADINLMLTSMLRSAGLNANPVLVSTRNNGVPLFPTIDGFNYVITMVNVGEGYVLLDATEKYGLPNILPVRALNWNGRVVKKNGSSSWVSLKASSPATEEHFVNVKMDFDEAVTEGMIRSKYSNLSALNFRNRYNSIKEEEILTQMQDKYDIDVENFKVSNKLDLGKPITRMVKFSSEDLIEEINGKIYISPMLFFTQKVNPFKAKERKFPVDFASPWKDKFNITIVIPEGYTVESLPEQMAVGMRDNIGVFKYQVKHSGNKISVVCMTEFNEGKISPVYYQELKEFYKKLVEKQLEKIILVKS